jgi:hypothetical protein
MDKSNGAEKGASSFCKIRMIHPKSLAGAMGFVSLLIYLGVAVLTLLVGLIWPTDVAVTVSLLLSLGSGAVVVPAFFFMLGALIALGYNGYATLTGGITVEVNALWNP